ncbi:MAG: rhodanese-like domain-containing protein [Acidimicrobiales bacterium]|nr:rhodanese-like domain-containing protein [Acidimicrobiales bacterium]
MPPTLFLRQYDLACLSLYSYLVGDTTTGRAVVVDPQRDVSEYLTDAAANGLRIERVLETHFHADFVSGHLELAEATGAVISYGDVAETDFPIDPLSHGQRLSLGEVTLEIRHTPGHTPEAISIVVHEHPDRPPAAVLTGDTLFIGDVGRPDLLTSVGRTADSLAQDLYRSLHEQLLTLPDDTLVYPAHGAGSACGKNLSTAASSTIGEQRATNYALAPMTVDAFVEAVTDGQGVAPLYFAFAADANKRDHDLLDDHEPPPSLTIDEALDLAHQGAVLLDTRSSEAFASGHLRGSVNVGLDGRFAEYAGDVIRPGQQVVLLGDHSRGTEAKVRLARIGFDDVAGEVPDLEAVLIQRPELARTAPRLPAGDVAAWQAEDPNLQIVDVRNPGETKVGGSVPGALNLPLPQLLDHLEDLDPARPTVVYCAGGYRSSIAASTLRAHGFDQVADLIGGYTAWTTANPPTHQGTEPIA